jgi:hypothetical protein
MPSSKSQLPVTCPNCQQRFVTEVYHVLDASSDPALTWDLISGKVNQARCPHCGMAGILGLPFAYHDPEKQLLFIFVPPEARLSAPEQEKLIGRCSSRP